MLADASHVLSSVLSSLIRLSLAIVIHNAGLPKTAIQSYAGIGPVSLISQLCRAILPDETHSWEVAKAAAQRAHNVALRLRSIRSSGESDEYADLLEALQGREVVEQPPASETMDFAALIDSMAPPTESLGLFSDPSFSWSNLDIWLSNLDGNNLQTYDDPTGFQFQTDYA